MKVLKYIFSMMLLGGIISACADLDTKLTNEWSESDTWRDADMAQGVLLSVYQDVMIAPDAWDGNFLDAATDNALTRNYDSKVYRASQGAFSRSTNPLGNWSSCYDQLQR
ncbi:RagB/SusD family nutrient uptake outer membrane protein, partial [Bacteroides ovatus]